MIYRPLLVQIKDWIKEKKYYSSLWSCAISTFRLERCCSIEKLNSRQCSSMIKALPFDPLSEEKPSGLAQYELSIENLMRINNSILQVITDPVTSLFPSLSRMIQSLNIVLCTVLSFISNSISSKNDILNLDLR